MTGYKVLHLGPDGVFRSPYVLNFTWEVGPWMQARSLRYSTKTGFYACDGETVREGLHCFHRPMALATYVTRNQHVAVVEGDGLIKSNHTMADFRQMRITGWYTGNIEGKW